MRALTLRAMCGRLRATRAGDDGTHRVWADPFIGSTKGLVVSRLSCGDRIGLLGPHGHSLALLQGAP
jgi:hypothetical protein